ncbi:HalOD1 output domain-containing protein [Halomicrococcus sp. NG-SE-24]|uniref:HalOD1 output domain-containing protein n=1 Tax=Halomicrococcus sp. NG-SE-24 TaxID=3436928 RepID=UPI003D9936B1
MTDNRNPQSGLTQHKHSEDETDCTLKTAIVTHIAAKKDIDPTTLDPLYDVINPEALEALFAPQFDGTPRTDGRIVFAYSGYRVTVTSEDDIESTPLDTTKEK